MDISELSRREDFHGILTRTLEVAWSREQGRPVTVRPEGQGDEGQRWRHHPVHNAYTVSGVGPTARRFLANSIRYTARRWRRPAQWVAGTAMSTSAGLALGQRPGLVVTPPLERAADLVLAPGNQRIRLFDFGTGRTRVYAKDGFPFALMTREIALRTGGDAGPYPPILAHDESMTWFEEPILAGWCLARCPATVDPTAAVGAALQGLDSWTQAGARTIAAAPYMKGLEARIRAALAMLVERFDHDVSPWSGWLEPLLERAVAGEMAVGPTHGDCQYGNVMVGPDGGGALIDWEHHHERWVHYDRMVLGLQARFQAGLPKRMLAYMAGDALQWHPEAASDRAWRDVAIARYLLEDSVFQVEEAALGPYRKVTDGLCDREAGMRSLGSGLEALWRA